MISLHHRRGHPKAKPMTGAFGIAGVRGRLFAGMRDLRTRDELR